MKNKKRLLGFIGSGIFLFILAFFDLSFVEARIFQSNAPLLILNDEQEEYLLGIYIDYLEDPSQMLGIEQVSSPEFIDSFIRGETDILNFGMADSVYWLRFVVINEAVDNERWLLELARPSMNSVFLYEPSASGRGFIESKTGYVYPFSTRDVMHENFVFNLDIDRDVEHTYYLRVKDISLDVPLRIWEEDEFTAQDKSSGLVTSLSFGALAVMLVYNLVLLLGLRDRGFLYYVFFQLFLLLSLSSVQAYTSRYLWPNATTMNVFIIPLAVELAAIFLLLFSRDFLNYDTYPKCMEYAFYALLVLLTLSIPPTFYVGARIFILVFPPAAGVFTYVFLLGVWALRWKHKPARYYMFSWSLFLIIGFAMIFQRIGWITIENFAPEQALQLGAVFLVTFQSLAQVDRINFYKQGHLDNQGKLILEQQETLNIKDKLNTTLKNARLELEKRVTQRTQELTEVNTRLAEEITERKQSQDELQRLANTDPLTGLFNRRRFFEIAGHEFVRSTRYKRPLSFILLDIDFFKRINDTYGHLFGDESLVHLGKLITKITRESDTAARYGGEEFIFLLPETDIEGALVFAERLRQLIEASPINIEKEEIFLTVSQGVAGADPQEISETSLDNIISQADQALYKAKNTGRNRVVCYNPSLS